VDLQGGLSPVADRLLKNFSQPAFDVANKATSEDYILRSLKGHYFRLTHLVKHVPVQGPKHVLRLKH
jgi:hypothetical protein